MTTEKIRKMLGKHDQPGLECDGFTRVASYLLSEEGVGHSVFEGLVKLGSAISVEPHFWIVLDDGMVVDYKLRMWTGDSPIFPHGVFLMEDFPRVTYTGQEVKLMANKMMFDILTMELDGDPQE